MQAATPMITVLMAVYNEQDRLKDTIDSILTQTYAEFEFIIVDDGSKDDTYAILEEYSRLDNRIKIIQNIKNMGLTKSLNVGLQKAQGKYIACMDVCLIPFKKGAIAENAVPLKLFEYMACEKPVVSTPLRGVKQAVDDMVLYASTAEELKSNVMRVYRDERLRRKLGEDGRSFVKENYSWVNVCSRIKEILLDMAKQ